MHCIFAIAKLPSYIQASYVKAIDIWMGACMAFVVNYCTRRKDRNKTPPAKGLSEQVHDLVTEYREKRKFKNVNSYYDISICPDNSKSQSSIEKKQIRELNQSPLLFRRSLLSSTKRKQLEERINRVEENRKYAQLIDRHSRLYFPLAFILFNIIYWTYYIKYAEGILD
uniref:Neur_chan_memb domain-containing protein n=1 Tax=Heterorhabditis bacteriophora TaxID=37862 RepID=A0A1I7XPR9_HETBA